MGFGQKSTRSGLRKEGLPAPWTFARPLSGLASCHPPKPRGREARGPRQRGALLGPRLLGSLVQEAPAPRGQAAEELGAVGEGSGEARRRRRGAPSSRSRALVCKAPGGPCGTELDKHGAPQPQESQICKHPPLPTTTTAFLPLIDSAVKSKLPRERAAGRPGPQTSVQTNLSARGHSWVASAPPDRGPCPPKDPVPGQVDTGKRAHWAWHLGHQPPPGGLSSGHRAAPNCHQPQGQAGLGEPLRFRDLGFSPSPLHVGQSNGVTAPSRASLDSAE